MCTVTIVRLGETLRLASNRDELRTRSAALPPEIRQLGPHRAIMPIDPISSGTWIAVNDAGLATTLLNVNPQNPDQMSPESPWRSRGELIPALMTCSTMVELISTAGAFDPARYPPFRIVAMNLSRWAELRSDGRLISTHAEDLGVQPLFFTSSGLGDHLVEAPRRALFKEMFMPGADLAAQQAAFHRHAWPAPRHLSVNMERAEARTVSHTIIDLAHGHCTLTYHAGAPTDNSVADVSLSLPEAPR